jgi:hypothetical protein
MRGFSAVGSGDGFAFSYGQPQAADHRKAPAPKNASAQIK